MRDMCLCRIIFFFSFLCRSDNYKKKGRGEERQNGPEIQVTSIRSSQANSIDIIGKSAVLDQSVDERLSAARITGESGKSQAQDAIAEAVCGDFPEDLSEGSDGAESSEADLIGGVASADEGGAAAVHDAEPAVPVALIGEHAILRGRLINIAVGVGRMLVCGGNGVRGADVALGRRGLYGAIGSGFCRVEEIELRGIAAAGASERRNGEIGASRVDEDGEFLSVASDRNLPTKPNQKKKKEGGKDGAENKLDYLEKARGWVKESVHTFEK